jgi:hypothetical protein
MAKYKVLCPIELDGILYLPKQDNPPATAPSSGGGKNMSVPVNAEGEIELTDLQAAPMIYGQVPLCDGKPDPINGETDRVEKAAFEKKRLDEKVAAEKAEYEEFVAFRAAKAEAKEKKAKK